MINKSKKSKLNDLISEMFENNTKVYYMNKDLTTKKNIISKHSSDFIETSATSITGGPLQYKSSARFI